MITPEEFITKNKELEKSYNIELKSIAKKHGVTGNAMFDDPHKDDPENLRKAKVECKECGIKHGTEFEDLKSKFTETYNKLVEDSENYQKLKGKGDKKMEQKDEKEIENVVSKLLERQNKNSKFESTISDIHSKISKIDSIEKGLVDIIPKIQKIDSICEDGKCFKTELMEIKKDLAETKKGKISAEICPGCGEKAIMHSDTFLASHCSNCGGEVPEWLDDNGVPIVNWKNYKLRGK